uniref:peptide-methionine (S)-S-oxide reductase n=1 Tax=Nothobranchius furzeri TaxID=105023 RepID=A0A8C6KVW7_NOTFU
ISEQHACACAHTLLSTLIPHIRVGLTEPPFHAPFCLIIIIRAALDKHVVNGNPTVEPFPDGTETIVFGMGCFWGAERLFWRLPGVFSTQVGYAGGFTPNPTYEEVCSGLTGHTEVVRVVFFPQDISLEELLGRFWENHDPTQGMRQQNDRGTQYRSAIYTSNPTQQEVALMSKVVFQQVHTHTHTFYSFVGGLCAAADFRLSWT